MEVTNCPVSTCNLPCVGLMMLFRHYADAHAPRNGVEPRHPTNIEEEAYMFFFLLNHFGIPCYYCEDSGSNHPSYTGFRSLRRYRDHHVKQHPGLDIPDEDLLRTFESLRRRVNIWYRDLNEQIENWPAWYTPDFSPLLGQLQEHPEDDDGAADGAGNGN